MSRAKPSTFLQGRNPLSQPGTGQTSPSGEHPAAGERVDFGTGTWRWNQGVRGFGALGRPL